MENTDDLIISRSVIRKIIDDPDCKNQGFMFFNELSENANFMEALQARNYNDLQIEHLELLFKSFMKPTYLYKIIAYTISKKSTNSTWQIVAQILGTRSG